MLSSKIVMMTCFYCSFPVEIIAFPAGGIAAIIIGSMASFLVILKIVCAITGWEDRLPKVTITQDDTKGIYSSTEGMVGEINPDVPDTQAESKDDCRITVTWYEGHNFQIAGNSTCLFNILVKLTITKKHQSSTFLSIGVGNPPFTGGFSSQRDGNYV